MRRPMNEREAVQEAIHRFYDSPQKILNFLNSWRGLQGKRFVRKYKKAFGNRRKKYKVEFGNGRRKSRG